MTEQQIKDTLLEDRGNFYNCDKETFFKKGTTVKHREVMDGKGLIYVSRICDRIFISCGKEVLNKIETLLDEELNVDRLRKIFPDLEVEDTYPHFLYYKDTIPKIKLPENYSIVDTDPSDHPPLQRFLDGCTEEDIEDALIDLDDPDEVIHLVYHGDTPVGYAGYRRWGKNMGDVGILIQEEHRKKGLGMQSVASVTEACLKKDCLPFYRTSYSNQGSEKIARAVGYKLEWITSECKVSL